jgi:hypothetical protein
MVGIGAANMAVQGELESGLVETLVEAGFDPTSEDVIRAANTVLVELKEEYGDTEQLLSVIKDDPTIVARISVLIESEEDKIEDPVGEPGFDQGDEENQEPIDGEEPLEDGDLSPGEDLEEPVEEDRDEYEESDLEKPAPRERAIERLKEHLERGLPVENALLAVTKEKHRLRWAEREREGQEEVDDVDEDEDVDLDDMDIDEDVDDTDDMDIDEDADDIDEDIDGDTEGKIERKKEQLKAKEEKEAAKRERKLAKEKDKQAKRDKKAEAKKARGKGKGQK